MHGYPKAAPYMLGLLAAAVILVATSAFGIGVTSESETYTLAAQNMALGHGLTVYTRGGAPTLLTQHAPLYAALLGAFGRCGIDPVAAARWLSAALFGLTVVLAGLILKPLCRASWLPPLGSLFTLFSVVLLNLHLTALSEPLFIVCQLACLYLFLRYLFTSKMRFLLFAAAACALALLTRFAGAALVAAGIAGLLFLDGNASHRRRAAHASLFAVLSCLPMLPWMAYTATHTGNPVDRTFGVHFPPPGFFLAGISSLSTWILPGVVPLAFRLLVLILGIAVLCAAFRRAVRTVPAAEWHKQILACRLFLIFGVAYVVVAALSRSFLDVAIILDDRILSPLYVPALLTALLLVVPQLSFSASRRMPAVVCAAALATMIAADAVRIVPSLVRMHRVGRGYTGAEWRHSTLLPWLRTIGPATLVYSNVDSAVRFFRGGVVPGLPSKFHTKSGEPDALYTEKMKQLSTDLRSGHGVLVYFADAASESSPTQVELTSGLGLQVIAGEGNWRAIGFRESEAPGRE
jgi:4-amino-4-deoxy-L-arabinose transferase-like glycosyltransferase